MKLIRRPSVSKVPSSIVTIGNFDGIHSGHLSLIEKTVSLAKKSNCESCVLTFEPYPKSFFNPDKKVPRLTTLREKLFLIQLSGIDWVYALPFDHHLSLYTPEQFIDEVLLKQLNTKTVVVGDDFRFGFQRAGDVALLKTLNKFETIVMPSIVVDQHRVSSTLVRESLESGDLQAGEKLLSHPYFMMGKVVQGNRRGNTLGFPTANISLKNRLAPIAGVYAVRVFGASQEICYGVANIGTRPTVDGINRFLEVHLFDFNKDLYGRYLRVEFVRKLRDEMKFESLEHLKSQIQKDTLVARECFK